MGLAKVFGICERFSMASRFAARLLREMERSELTYEQYAAKLGIPKSQLHDWIHETHEPRLETLRRIAKKLKCDVSDLIEAA